MASCSFLTLSTNRQGGRLAGMNGNAGFDWAQPNVLVGGNPFLSSHMGGVRGRM